MPVIKPNLFIVGAPKSGTTTIYSYLRHHPSVFMSRRKEPHFFSPDLYAPRYVRELEEYLALFAEGGGKSFRGEASVYYLYSGEAASRIRNFAPDARILVMLRNPVEMVYSLHSQRYYSGYEDIATFEEALEAEEERKRGWRIPPNGYPVPCLFYRELGKYAGQVERYLKSFSRDQIHFILFDDFVADTKGEYRRLCGFLGIPSLDHSLNEVRNPNKRVRSAMLRSLIKFQPRIKGTLRSTLPMFLLRPGKRALVRLNTRYQSRPPLDPATRKMLQEDFATDIDRLSRLIGKDLSDWKAPPKPGLDGREPRKALGGSLLGDGGLELAASNPGVDRVVEPR